MLDWMVSELERLQERLGELDPTSKDYADTLKNYHELLEAFHEEWKVRDDDLTNEQKRELDKAKQTLAEKEAADRRFQAKLEAIMGLAKIGVTGGFTLAAILLTGTLEETTIMNNKCLSWIKAIAPRT